MPDGHSGSDGKLFSRLIAVLLKTKPKRDFHQNKVQGKPGFLHLPDGTRYQFRPEGSHEKDEGPNPKKSVVEVEFKELDDGRLVEMIEDPDAPGRTCLAVWEKGSTTVVKELAYKGQLLVPKQIDEETLRLIKLPTGTRSDQSAKDILGLVGYLIGQCIDVPDTQCPVLAAFALSTWIIDTLPVALYLWIVGPPQSGKTTLLNALALVCRRPLLVGDISSAALYDYCDTLKPTLLIDESNSQVGQSNRSLRQLLRLGTTRGLVANPEGTG